MMVSFRQLSLVGTMVVSAVLPARGQAPPEIAFSPNIEFMSAPVAFDNEQVTGAPFSAEAVTEVVQTLSDGNRIVRERKAKIDRDGQGRVRREQGLATFGPLIAAAAGGDLTRHVQISDPESKTTILLDLQNRTAHTIPAPQFRLMNGVGSAVKGGAASGGVTMDHFEVALPPPGAGDPAAGVQIFSSRAVVAGGAQPKPLVESLGSQFMEGVTAEGTRTTLTIAAGQIGNELPIQVISERWYSAELKQLVMSLQSDPRFGVTTYRLTNITRGEPSPDLFEIPSDFKVVDPMAGRRMIIERKMKMLGQ